MASPTPIQAFTKGFHESGFGIVKQAIDSGAVAGLRSRLDELLPPGRPGAEPPLQRLAPRLVEQGEPFIDLAIRPPMVEILTSLFDDVVPQLVCSYGHEKPARTAAHTGPHSDVAHLPGVPHHQSTLMVKAMYALTPVKAESGATMLHPGSHRLPSAEQATSGAGRPMLLDPGDLLIFHANIRHSATDNVSSVRRSSLWFVYALPWMRAFSGYEYTPDFIAGLRRRLPAEPHLGALFGLDDPYATTPERGRPS